MSAHGPGAPSLPDFPEHQRTAWIPKVRDGDGASTDSKFCGAAYLPPGSKWPLCGNCEEPIQLFVQLNTATLPDEAKRDLAPGLYQLFYCVSSDPHCESDCEAFWPKSRSVVARRVALPEGKPPVVTVPSGLEFPAKTIAGWESIRDLPNWEEFEELGVKLTDEQTDRLDALELPKSGDKLGGWPAWVQNVEYPKCPDCGDRMTLLFQVESEDNVPYMFGDAGCGHLTQCRKHPDRLAFGWACC